MAWPSEGHEGLVRLRVLVGIGVSLTVVAAVLSTRSDTARAYSGSTPYPTVAEMNWALTQPGTWPEEQALLNGTGSYGSVEPGLISKATFSSGAAGDGASIADEYWRIRRLPGLKILPAASDSASLLSRLGTVGLAAGAFTFGWKIGRAIDTKWLNFSGQAGINTGAQVSSANWHFYAAGTGTFGGTVGGGADHWVLRFDVGTGAAEVWSNCNALSCAGFDASQLAIYQGGFHYADVSETGDMSGFTGTGVTRTDTHACGASGSGKTCMVLWMTATAMAARFHPASALQNYTSQPFSLTDTCGTCGDASFADGSSDAVATQTDIVSNTSPAGKATIIHEIYPNVPSTVTAPSPTLPGGLDDPWNPGVQPSPSPAGEPAVESPPATFTLPAPLATETYTQYLTRLQVQGYVGTLTDHTLPSGFEDPTRERGKVSRTTPSPGTTIAVGDPVATYSNPDPCSSGCAPDGSTTSTGGGEPGGVPPPDNGGNPSSCCPHNSLNFNFPITCTSHFPCGLFTWAFGVITIFDVAPAAPDTAAFGSGLTVQAGSGAHVPSAHPHFDVSMSYFDSYMATIREILSWLMWIGATWFLASKLLGFKATSDVGEAMDEADYLG